MIATSTLGDRRNSPYTSPARGDAGRGVETSKDKSRSFHDREADAYVQASRLKAFAPSLSLVSNSRFRSSDVPDGTSPASPKGRTTALDQQARAISTAVPLMREALAVLDQAGVRGPAALLAEAIDELTQIEPAVAERTADAR